MKVACVDSSAQTRIQLQKLYEEALEESRNTIGHLNLVSTYPASIQEVCLNSAPDVVTVGSAFSVEEAFSACKKIRGVHPHVALFVILNAEVYSLRTLRRFERICDEIFSSTEPRVRLLHRIASVDRTRGQERSGKLILVEGAKGGVGSTTLTAALGHAAEAMGRQAIIADFSPSGALIQYMFANRHQSPDYAAALVDGLLPDRPLVERCITTAPNGVSLLLPPSGSTDIRELWLRDADRFEVTLGIFDHLREMYDLILIDVAGTEGILPYALGARAHGRLLVSSNDPAAVHLLAGRLAAIPELSGETVVHILLNLFDDKGLTKSDVTDFLVAQEQFQPLMMSLPPIPFERRGKNWIGTGNTFFTESTRSTQQLLEEILGTLLLTNEELEIQADEERGVLSGLRRLVYRGKKRGDVFPAEVLGLPAPSKTKTAPQEFSTRDQLPAEEEPYEYSIPQSTEENTSDETASEDSQMYEAPQLMGAD